MPDFLLELGTEEIPAGYLDRAVSALVQRIQKDLVELNLPASAVQGAATPRRIAIHAAGLAERQPDQNVEKSGPRVGAPEQAVTKFAASQGLTVEQLEVRPVKKGKKTADYYFAVREEVGRPALEVLAESIPGWIESTPSPKSMRWIPGEKLKFARPLRRITALFGGEVVPAEWAGVRAGREVEGHRFLAPDPIELADASWESYRAALEAGKVVLEGGARRERIAAGLGEHMSPELLAKRQHLVQEVANLVEWPQVDVASFDERFLELPRIVVEEAMMDHQRYFPLEDGESLAPRFCYVANRPFHQVIREGNQRVLAARLEDALFFFRLDQKRPLTDRINDLDEIVFMQELGSYKARIDRVDPLALEVAEAAGWLHADEAGSGAREKTRAFGAGDRLAMNIQLAARLARTDLTTEVVQEFTSLQGEMGAIYARLAGLADEVAEAIREAYLPRGEGDDLPRSKAGVCLAIADKLDTVVSAWATGKKPTGSKDPFMVRRSVLGILKIVRARGLDLGVRRLIDKAVALLPSELQADGLAGEIQVYFRDRIRVLGREEQNHQLVEAALAAGRDPSNVLDFWARLEALGELAQDERFPRLCELVERCLNITAKNGPDVDPQDVDVSRLEHEAEQALHAALESHSGQIREAIGRRDYVQAGQLYVEGLADVTHTFFEPAPVGVFVMDDDERLRTNRLALLKQVSGMLAAEVADLAKIDVGSL